MGTTVKYNNNVITTLSNETKKLTTSGKWMESDIEIEDTAPTLQTKSATPTESVQTITADSGYDGLSSVEISAISGTYVGSQVPTQAAQTIHPSTSVQTIASGKYLTGDQTIEAVTTTNLTAANIKSGVVVKVGSATDDDSVLSLTGTAETGGATLEDEANATGTTAVITGEVPEYGTKTITENGTYAAEDDGYDGYSEVTVNIPSSGGYSIDEIANGGSSISGAITITGTYIRQYAFCDTDITSVDAPNLINGGAGYYFKGCTKLVSANLPKFAVTNSAKAAGVFGGCSSLETVNAPLMRIGGSSFDGCVKLKKYVNIQTTQMNLGSYEFRNCSSLEALDLNKIGQFGTSPGWNNTSKLITIVLRRSDAIVPLNNANNVPPTMKSNGTGCTVYVPSALVSTYETATNWSTLVAGGNLTFVAIEGSQYENYYADGTAIS